MAWTIVILILVVFLLYAFAWIVAFPLYLCWMIWSFFRFLLDLVKFNIYPVWDIVYIFVAWILVFLVFRIIFKLIAKNH